MIQKTYEIDKAATYFKMGDTVSYKGKTGFIIDTYKNPKKERLLKIY